MKVIFLETNGVLVTHRTQFTQRAEHTTFDHVAVSLLNEIIRATNAKVVFTSSEQFTDKDFYSKIEENGFDRKIIHTDAIDFHYSIASRETAIMRWLSRHPEVSGAVVISDVMPDSDNTLNKITTSTYNGMTYGNFIECMNLFTHQHDNRVEIYKR